MAEARTSSWYQKVRSGFISLPTCSRYGKKPSSSCSRYVTSIWHALAFSSRAEVLMLMRLSPT
eukprot:766868-Hanusia_phi.AAC.2